MLTTVPLIFNYNRTVTLYASHNVSNHRQLDCLFDFYLGWHQVKLQDSCYWTFVRGINRFSLTKGSQCGKHFNVRASSRKSAWLWSSRKLKTEPLLTPFRFLLLLITLINIWYVITCQSFLGSMFVCPFVCLSVCPSVCVLVCSFCQA